MDTDDGTHVTGACFQPPDAENRTSGGVEGSRGAIPATPSDQKTPVLQRFELILAEHVKVAASASEREVCPLAGARGYTLSKTAITQDPASERLDDLVRQTVFNCLPGGQVKIAIGVPGNLFDRLTGS